MNQTRARQVIAVSILHETDFSALLAKNGCLNPGCKWCLFFHYQAWGQFRN